LTGAAAALCATFFTLSNGRALRSEEQSPSNDLSQHGAFLPEFIGYFARFIVAFGLCNPSS
jgi:hypothetical protein